MRIDSESWAADRFGVLGRLPGYYSARYPLAASTSQRTPYDSQADLRWGVDRSGYRRLVHPKGICLSMDG